MNKKAQRLHDHYMEMGADNRFDALNELKINACDLMVALQYAKEISNEDKMASIKKGINIVRFKTSILKPIVRLDNILESNKRNESELLLLKRFKAYAIQHLTVEQLATIIDMVEQNTEKNTIYILD